MRTPRLTTVVAYAALALTAGVALTLPDSIRRSAARLPDSPATIDLTGVVRDFRRDHPDFDVVPANGYGHYAGNIALTIGESGRPVFGAGPGAVRHVLLVVPSAGSLSAQDAAKKSLIESWGWNVTLISAGATQAQYDAAVAGAEVAYISEEVAVSNPGTQLRSAPIGVVSEDRPINDELGLCSSSAEYAATTIEITDPSHDITLPLSAGVLAITSVSQPLRNVSGTPAGGLTALARKVGAAAGVLSVIEQGGALYGGGTAAGRRVHLPWGGSTFDVNMLNNDGRTILRRSLDWAAALSSVNGFKVTSQWRQRDSRPIPPHLYVSGASGPAEVHVVSAPSLTNSPVLDSWNSNDGPYGGANIGPAPTFITGSAMPPVSEPTGMPAKVSEYLRSGAGTSTISADLHVDKFDITNNHIVKISGTVRLCVHELFKLQNYARIELNPGATLTIYVHKDATVQDFAELNRNTWDPGRVRIINLGSLPFIVQNGSQVVAEITSPGGALHLQDSGHFYGSVTASTVTMQNSAGLHVNVGGGPAPQMCGVAYSDTAGAAGVTSSGGITSADSFDHWFSDVPGVNLSMPLTITLTDNGSGVYEYLNDAFHPIDGQLLTNEGESHNNYFTFTFDVDFTFRACRGQFFEFQGCDDVWVFIDGGLAMDLGGVLPGTEQLVEVDRLGLTDGEVYSLRFYYAQRQGTQAVFRVRTNLEFIMPDDPVVVSGSFD